MQKQHITLTDADRQTLEGMLHKGSLPVRTFKRATALLELDRGKTFQDVATTVHVTPITVASWRNSYRTHGIRCLQDAPRSGRPIEISGVHRAAITALACSEAPTGHDRWTLRLLADKAVERGLCPSISHSMVGMLLKKTI